MSYGWKNHLCGSIVTESARSRPVTRPASRSDSRTAPPYAASTWSQSPSRSARSASSFTGSTEPVLVDPATGAMQNGVSPAARSSAMAAATASARRWYRSSDGSTRSVDSGNPNMSTPRAIEKCA